MNNSTPSFPLPFLKTDTEMLAYIDSTHFPDPFFYPEVFERIMAGFISNKFNKSFIAYFKLSLRFQQYLSTSYFLIFVAVGDDDELLTFLCTECQYFNKLVEHEILHRLIHLGRVELFQTFSSLNNIDISHPENNLAYAAKNKKAFEFIFTLPVVVARSFKLNQEFHNTPLLNQYLKSHPDLFL